ncbi:hypothetical protein FQB35_14525 [Crassaminicella thermophila]|uniref:Uncharacterized protein n=1 Tax=Crassaminicella thermophila TaxID=2599308 RepID=A0A5C0SJI1_CRATE|nr:hypothetical protein [Crassaminicella thermophila]QEK13388.1 hypothetical protein FQB35_14525 [Crassaminicella thermophila]
MPKEPLEKNYFEESFMYSNTYFFIKSYFQFTKEKLEVKVPKLLLFLPIGKIHDSYSFDDISEIKVETKPYSTSFFLGILLSYWAFDTFNKSLVWGFLFLLIGISTILNAYRTSIIITNKSEEVINYPISFFERSKGEAFVSKINSMLNGKE